MKRWERLGIPIAIFLIILFVGAYVYHRVEGWRYLDSLYFSVATVTTVGYGDFFPKTDAGKIFTIIFIFTGMGLALYLITQIAKLFARRRLDKERGIERLNLRM